MFRLRRSPHQRLLNVLNRRRERTLPNWVFVAVLLVLAPFCSDFFTSSVAVGQDAVGQETVQAEVEEKTSKTTSEDSSTNGKPDTGAHKEEDGHEGEEDHAAGGHENVAAPLFAAIVLILFFAKVAGDLFERVGMPAVLGELTVGIVLGNIALISSGVLGPDHAWHMLDFLKAPEEHSIGDVYNTGAALKMLAEIGVVLLLFEVGLETSVRDMMKVGKSALLVAVLGVVVPLALGVGIGWVLLQHEPWQVWLFLGATLCATSVGITARVLKDLGRSKQRESQVILGAAVIDDVLGLIILAVVCGIIEQGDQFSMSALGIIIVKAVGFLIVAVLLGTHLLVKPLFKAASYLRGRGLLVATSLVICFGLAYLANLVGLAPIVGAFAAGLILEHAHYQDLGKKEHVELEEALGPLTALLVPIFFVQMGIMVDLSSFADPSVWLLAGTITVAAIIGKQVCSFGVLEKGLNKIAIGLGMIPRGEVGLIFANVGLSLRLDGEPVVSPETYSAIIVMVILTTMVTPPLLKWSLDKPVAGEEQPA